MTDAFDLKQLKMAYERSSDYAHLIRKGDWLANREDTSEFWQQNFRERKNYPSFEEMLHMRRGATYPLADRAGDANRESEQEHAQAAYYVVTNSIPKQFLKTIKESELGQPLCFPFDEGTFTPGGITNALTAYRIIEWCQTRGLANRPLRVLEIGAGYGQMALQLHQKLAIQSYTICDLPENLFLSSFYLQANLPARRPSFISPSGPTKEDNGELVFLIPPFLDSIKGPFDLIVNSYSFQEMNLKSVQDYFAYASTHLSDDGIFYSLNAHRKSGVIWPSDYTVESFELLSFLPTRKYPFQLFATNPYEMVLKKKQGISCTAKDTDASKHQLDALGILLQLGLHEDIGLLCKAFTGHSLTVSETQWLEDFYHLIHTDEAPAKLECLESLRRSAILTPVVNYLAASLQFALHHWDTAAEILRQSVASLSDSHAKVRSYVMLSVIEALHGRTNEKETWRLKALAIVPHLKREINHIIECPDIYALQTAQDLYLKAGRKRLSWTGISNKIQRKLKQFGRQKPVLSS